MSARLVCALSFIVALGGCSALGLSDGLDERAGCGDCSELDLIEPPGPCLSWQCVTGEEPGAGFCEVDLQDGDGDGSPDVMCALDERPADCAEDDARNGWMLTETCDLQDNDCDGAIDEDSLTPSRAELVSAAGVEHLSYASGDVEAVAVYGASPGELVVSTLPFTGGAETTSLEVAVNPDPRSVAIARTGTDWAVALAPRAGCSRAVLGTWSPGSSAFGAPAGHFGEGLPKVSGDCAGSDTSPVGALALASANPQQVVLAYLADAGERSCDATPNAAEVALVAAQRPGASGAFVGAGQVSAAAVRVGESVDAAPPAVLAIGGAFGYLVAFPAADETIALHRATVDADTLAISVAPLAHVEACGGPCGDVALSAHDVGGERQIALTYRRGLCGESSAALRAFAVDGVELAPVGPALSGEPSPGARFPVAARRSDPAEWLLGWVVTVGTTRRVVVSRFDAAGEVVGVPLTVLESAGELRGPLAILGAVGRDGFAAFAYDSEVTQLVRGAAGCE